MHVKWKFNILLMVVVAIRRNLRDAREVEVLMIPPKKLRPVEENQ